MYIEEFNKVKKMVKIAFKQGLLSKGRYCTYINHLDRVQSSDKSELYKHLEFRSIENDMKSRMESCK